MRELLKSVKIIEFKIVRLQTEIEALETCLLPNAVQYDKDRVQTSPDDMMSGILAEVADKAVEICQLRFEKHKLIVAMHEKIENLSDDFGKLVLTEYFIGQRPLRLIGERLHYSKSQIYRVFEKSLEEIEDGTNGTKRDTHT